MRHSAVLSTATFSDADAPGEFPDSIVWTFLPSAFCFFKRGQAVRAVMSVRRSERGARDWPAYTRAVFDRLAPLPPPGFHAKSNGHRLELPDGRRTAATAQLRSPGTSRDLQGGFCRFKDPPPLQHANPSHHYQ